jgi:hypothetical protein
LPFLLLGRGTQETVGAAEPGGEVAGDLVLVGTEAIVGEGVGRKDAEGVGKLVKDVGAIVAIALQMAGLGSSRIDCNERFARNK